jgi:phosphoribosylanthranilate isomerase
LFQNPEIDFLGSIFFPSSKRFTDAAFVQSSPKNVAVFVNESEAEIRKIAKRGNFQTLQLHGKETVEVCAKLKSDFTLIKAFGIDSSFDFGQLAAYESVVDYFLFDTKTENHGGSGIKFNWNILSSYVGKTPFFLSGGLKPEDAVNILQWKHPLCVGIDINSGFELEPGVKNVAEIQAFIQKIKKQKL